VSDRTDKALAAEVDAVAETVRAYVDQIASGADEPTVDDTPIGEYPLEIVDERGKEFAVVISTGGPHVEVVADGFAAARLEGYWSGWRVTRYGDYLSVFLDYFIDREGEA
jgi:hypothetical protein